MGWKEYLKKERLIWHDHFIPSIIAGLAVAIIALVLEATVSNIILFASVGASAVILTNSKSHHLTKLHTTIIAYFLAMIIALIIFSINIRFPLHLAVNVFLLVFLVSLFIYLANASHPPAVSASLAFILYENSISQLFYLFLTIIALFVVIRLITYIFSQHLSIRKFFKEFTRSFS